MELVRLLGIVVASVLMLLGLAFSIEMVVGLVADARRPSASR